MGKYYNRFLGKKIDLSPLGVEKREEEYPYFCTPRGASIIGSEGVDGIHYCFVRGFGEMVFAVSPMEIAPDYVRPIAASFEDFLGLLLACGNAGLLEQGCRWSQAQFDQAIAQRESDPASEKTLLRIAEAMNLTPMEKPWAYMQELQKGFDYSKIKYTEDFYDPDMNPDAPEEKWAVYYSGSIYGYCGREKPGTELVLGKQFEFANRSWVIPAVYTCSKGIVMDLCMRVETDRVQKFLDHWNEALGGRDEEELNSRERLIAQLENPMWLDFESVLRVNGRALHQKHGSSISYVPGMENSRDEKGILAHYGLSRDCAWNISRICFPWAGGRRAEIKTLELTLAQNPLMVPGEVFEVTGPGDRIPLRIPGKSREILLTVQEYEPSDLGQDAFPSEDLEFPSCYTILSYTLSPEVEGLEIRDLDESEFARPKSRETEETHASSHAAVLGIIGGADGPTAICVGAEQQENVMTQCSALHFEPPEKIQWYPVLEKVLYTPVSVKLMEPAMTEPER